MSTPSKVDEVVAALHGELWTDKDDGAWGTWAWDHAEMYWTDKTLGGVLSWYDGNGIADNDSAPGIPTGARRITVFPDGRVCAKYSDD